MNKSQRKNRNRKRNNKKKKSKEKLIIEEIEMLKNKMTSIENYADDRIDEMKDSDRYIDIVAEKEKLESKASELFRLMNKVNILQTELHDIYNKKDTTPKEVGYTDDEIKEIKKVYPSLEVIDRNENIEMRKQHAYLRSEALKVGRKIIAYMYKPDGSIRKIIYEDELLADL